VANTDIISALQIIINEHQRADKVIEQTLRSKWQWESEERGDFVKAVHDALRWWRWWWFCASQPDAECLTRVSQQSIRRALAAGSHPRPGGTPAVRASFPDWLWARGSSELGKKWPTIAEALNQPANMYLRANTLRNDAASLSKTLEAEGISCKPLDADAVIIRGSREVFGTNAFKGGMFEVQDVNSQRIAPLLDAKSGMRVIDACAGAGGKSLQIAALMKNKGRIIALDSAEWKLTELRRRAARAGVDNLEARCITDAKQLKRLAGSADCVLIDVPCSGLGVIRRNPDIKWRLTESELKKLCELQAKLLRDYSRFLKSGGRLVYATCSILPSENERIIKSFLFENKDWRLIQEHRFLPGENDGDGFYAAVLTK
jgi:16S rRNA (cytosine967-C5)-methyltransferase